MNSRTKTILIVLAIILVPVAGGIGYWLYSRKKSEEDTPAPAAEPASAGTTPVSAGTSTTTPKNNNAQFPVIFNESTKSALVKECQEVINEQIKDCIAPMCPTYDGKQIKSLTVDGYYGKKTAAAVKYLFPATDGKTITESMYNQLIGKRESGSYLLF